VIINEGVDVAYQANMEKEDIMAGSPLSSDPGGFVRLRPLLL
jgi:hypothetical protein